MTDGAGLPGWQARDEGELLAQQLEALSRWHEHRRATEEVIDLRGLNRDVRLDWERRQMVRSRQYDALMAHAQVQLSRPLPVRSRPCPRAVLVDRRDWVRGKVAVELARRGVEVVAQLGDGAAGVGVAVLEQPDLLLVEEALPSMSGSEVLRAVREFCAGTTCAAQVESERHGPGLLEAGAARVFLRRTSPPAQLATGLVELLTDPQLLPYDDDRLQGVTQRARGSDDRVSPGR